MITKRSVSTGLIETSFDIAPLIDSDPNTEHETASAMTIVGDSTDPYMLVSALESINRADNYVLALDLDAETIEWEVEVPPPGNSPFIPAGQYAVVENGSGDTRIVFSGAGTGVWAIGAP